MVRDKVATVRVYETTTTLDQDGLNRRCSHHSVRHLLHKVASSGFQREPVGARSLHVTGRVLISILCP